MTGSIAVDIVIGLVFIFLLYSLLASVIMEIIATWFGLRARNLKHGIIRLLTDDKKQSWPAAFISGYLKFFRETEKGLAKEFYSHPYIKYFSENSYHSKPSYLAGSTFSKVLVDLLRGPEYNAGDDPKTAISTSLKDRQIINKSNLDRTTEIEYETWQNINFLWVESQGDVEKFKQLIEEWFNKAQDRITGWYKRYTQVILFFVGLGIAIVLNADIFQIIDKLNRDPKATALLVEQAGAYLEKNSDSTAALQLNEEARIQVRADLKKANNVLGLGGGVPELYLWELTQGKTKKDSVLNIFAFYADSTTRKINKVDSCFISRMKGCEDFKTSKVNIDGKSYDAASLGNWNRFKYLFVGRSLSSWIGFVLMALAISLGAPFWFDLLNKLMALRASVREGENTNSGKKKSAGSFRPKTVG